MGKRARLKKLKKISSENIATANPSLPSSVLQKIIKTLPIMLCLCIFLVGAVVRCSNLNIPVRSPDEGVYASQARFILSNGVKGVRDMLEDHARNRELWIYPPPSRIGYLFALSATMKMTGARDEMAGTYISCVSSVVLLFLIGLIGLRFFNPWIAAVALFFASFSPMDLAIARRCWTDEPFACLGVAVIYFCCEIVRKPALIWYVLFSVVGVWFLLLKELAVVFYALCAAWLIFTTLMKTKDMAKVASVVVFTAAIALLSFFILASITGGTGVIFDVMKHIKIALPTNQYAIDYQAGPWYTIFAGLWILSPAAAFLGLIGTGSVLSPICTSELFAGMDDKDGLIRRGVAAIMLAFIASVVSIPYSHNLRYISVTFAPFYLMAGVGLWAIAKLAQKFLKGTSFYVALAVIVLALIMGAVNDYKNFEHTFIKKGIVDLSIRLLKESARPPVI